jgi:hypothetical protein
LYDEGCERLEEDFDAVKLIDELRDLRIKFELATKDPNL